MIPIRDANPTRKRAVVVPIFIAINAVVFFFVQPFSLGPSSQAQVADQFRFLSCNAAIPFEVMHGERLADQPDAEFGSARSRFFAEVQRQDCPRKSVWLSILFSMFMHGSVLHIAGNMLYLWVFGNNIEDRLGPLRFIMFYVLSGIAATYAQSVLSPDSAVPLIGASGAIAGVLGAYLLMFPRARITTLVIFIFISAVELPAVVVLGFWFVLQLFQSVGPGAADTGVAYMAHVGGFVAGMLLLLLFRPRRHLPPRASGYN